LISSAVSVRFVIAAVSFFDPNNIDAAWTSPSQEDA
jgi:hypothetical protein